MTCPWCRSHQPAGSLPEDARVSVVVTHYEQPDELARTLVALRRQDAPVHQVVVSDDGSTSPPRVPPGVELLTQPDLGFRAALARDRGAAAATGEVLVFLDADTVPEPSLVRRLADVVRAGPDVLVVGRRRHTRFGAWTDDPLAGVGEHELEEPAWLADGWAATDDLRRADDGSFRFFISALAACGRDWYDRVGGFDATFTGYGGEDWELAHRWWTAGGRLRHEPRAVGWHHGEHAGAGERRAADAEERRTREALAVARRVDAWPAAFRGLRTAPGRVVLTHDDDLTDRELVVAVDGLLAAAPTTEVVSDRALWGDLGDARVRPAHGPAGRTAALRVHLHRGVLADRDGWDRLLALASGRGPAGGAVDVAVDVVLGDDEGPVVTLTRLRELRRVHLGLREHAASYGPVPAGARAVGDTGLDAWLGGWARD